jgi:hypothetical protein
MKVKSKLKVPEGWTLLLTANKYQAQRKADGYTTELVGEKDDAINAIKLAIRHEQQERWNAHRARPVVDVADAPVAEDDATVEPAAKTVQDIPLTRLQPSPDNPRKHFDGTEMAELTATIRERGVEIVPGDRLRFECSNETGEKSREGSEIMGENTKIEWADRIRIGFAPSKAGRSQRSMCFPMERLLSDLGSTSQGESLMVEHGMNCQNGGRDDSRLLGR